VTGVPRETLVGTDFSNYFAEPENARSGYREVFEKGFVTDYPLTIRRHPLKTDPGGEPPEDYSRGPRLYWVLVNKPPL
jgi:hypothetical protein